MNDWQRTFLQKLDTAKKQWLHKFERFASDFVEPAFDEFAEFTANHGFRVATPNSEPGTRLYKFGLTENGYVLVTFRMRSLEEVEVCSEVFVPSVGAFEPYTTHASFQDATASWTRKQFQNSLERFVTSFGEAGSIEADRTEELVTA